LERITPSLERKTARTGAAPREGDHEKKPQKPVISRTRQHRPSQHDTLEVTGSSPVSPTAVKSAEGCTYLPADARLCGPGDQARNRTLRFRVRSPFFLVPAHAQSRQAPHPVVLQAQGFRPSGCHAEWPRHLSRRPRLGRKSPGIRPRHQRVARERQAVARFRPRLDRGRGHPRMLAVRARALPPRLR